MVQGVIFVWQKLMCCVAKDVHHEVELLPHKLYSECHKCLMCSFPSAFFKMQLHFLRHPVHKTVLGVGKTLVCMVSYRTQTLQLTTFPTCDICSGSLKN